MESRETLENLVFRMGADLLKCGAEIYRVEDTMHRIGAHYGIGDLDSYVISNGIFVSFNRKGGSSSTRVRDVDYVNIDLKKLGSLNELSRQIVRDEVTPEEALLKLDKIEKSQSDPIWRTVLAAGLGGAAFSFLLGASVFDCITVFLCGVMIQGLGSFVEYKGLNVSKVVATIGGSLFATLICVFFAWLGFSDNLDYTVTGAIIPMIPGVAFVNGIRDFVDGNYLSGFIRLADAFVIFMCLAIGVGLGIQLWS